jgi:predicted transcriptional regulator
VKDFIVIQTTESRSEMESQKGIEGLFFILSSESRLGILNILQHEDLRMTEIGYRLDLTGTEAFRQMKRLNDSLLVLRKSDGSYTLSEYGKTVLYLSSSYYFIEENKNYFLSHDLWALPPEFINRIGELRYTVLILDTMESINRGASLFIEAKEFAWAIVEHEKGPNFMDLKMTEGILEGLNIRILMPKEYLANTARLAPEKNIELKGLSDIPLILALNEREGFVGFRTLDGRMDYTGFFGNDKAFLNWVKDLFSYFWEKSKQFL